VRKSTSTDLVPLPRPVHPPYIPLWPPTEPAPPRWYHLHIKPQQSLQVLQVSSSRTPPVRLPPFPYAIPFGAPPSVDKSLPTVGHPHFHTHVVCIAAHPCNLTHRLSGHCTHRLLGHLSAILPLPQSGNDEDSETAQPDKFTIRTCRSYAPSSSVV